MGDSYDSENKSSLKTEAYALLQDLWNKHSPDSTILYLRREEYPHGRFWDLDLEKIRLLEAEELLTSSDYIRQGSVDSNVKQLNLQPKGLEFLKSRVTTTTQTITETFEPPEESAWVLNQRFRNRVRTERGNAITTSSTAALISNIRGHIQAIRSGIIPRKDMKSHQMWLMYCLLWRWDDIPEQLRHEAEDCRDLQCERRKKNT